MKKIITLSILLSFTTTFFGQQVTSKQHWTETDYYKKSKKQKTTGWVLLGGGTVLIGAGFLIGDRKESTFSEAGTGVVMGGVGFFQLLAASLC